MDYREYLKTDHWQDVRIRALGRAGFKCQLCGAENIPLNVHHNNYTEMWHEKMADVIVLCRQCHAYHHRGKEATHEIHAGAVCPHCGEELVVSLELKAID